MYFKLYLKTDIFNWFILYRLLSKETDLQILICCGDINLCKLVYVLDHCAVGATTEYYSITSA